MKKTIVISTLLVSLLAMQGCAWRDYSDSTYADGETQRAHSITMATVVSVRTITIERGVTGAGAAAGGSVGGIFGNRIGKGNGPIAGAVVGAVAGGLAGQAIEGELAKTKGLEISLRLDDGQMIAVVQGVNETFKAGDRVRVLTAEGKSRVSR